ncbi:DUF6571 family protein [Sphaerisporangium sp. NPDC088356]|uniref:DUF6571 family protein n=1 Tax=Sphaerisporangium sp. NPDC088356 TaxID=3154871 RepID=UPI00344342D6
MDGFITEMEHARGVIGERTEAIRRVFAAEGVSAASLDPIAEVEHWIDERLPDLRRRTQIARNTAKLPDWSPGSANGLRSYEENEVLPAAEARRLGAELASKYKKMNSGLLSSLSRDQSYQEIVDTLAAHVNDPEYTAAFFAALGRQGTLDLPATLRHNLAPPGESTLAPPRPNDEALRTVSQALGTAVSAGSHVPGFSQIKDSLMSTTMSGPDRFNAGLLLSAGSFPAKWLAQVAVAQGLGTPGKVNAGLLSALGNNPNAARLALSAVTGQDQSKLISLLKDLTAHTSGTASIAGEADAFGRMLAAASGAYDEKDGKHSKDAAAFAFTVITTLGHLSIGQETRIHLAEIAGAYATEITEGADLGDANHVLPGAFGDVKSRIAGLNPKFRLSPEDTYRFIKTFSDTLDHQIPFQAGIDVLTNRLVGHGVPDMLKTKDPTRLDDVFAALGNVSGLQLAAQEKLGRAKDDAAEASSKVTSWLIGTGMGVAGLTPLLEPFPLTWTALSTAEAYGDTFKADKETEVDKIRTADDEQTLGRQHAIAQALMNAGFTPKISPHEYQATHPSTVPISDSDSDSDSRLRPFADILKSGNDGLNALDRWFIENGIGGQDDFTLGKISERLADRYIGQKFVALPRAHLYEN